MGEAKRRKETGAPVQHSRNKRNPVLLGGLPVEPALEQPVGGVHLVRRRIRLGERRARQTKYP